uniref:aldehyde dehydrogenase family protein n=1 Tax=Aldersonia kunmingensis TaxID=408066 RepID=UPI000A9D05EA
MNAVLDRTKIYVDGKWTDSEGTGKIEVINPATEEVIAVVAEGTAGDVDKAAKAARAAFDSWSALDGAKRGEYLRKAAGLVQERIGDLAALVSQDMGMPVAFAGPIQVGMPMANLFAFADLAENYDFDSHEIGNSKIVKE